MFSERVSIVDEYDCPACSAAKGQPCDVRLADVDTTGWSHDARILEPLRADLRNLRATTPPTDTASAAGGGDRG